jgi:hypothetical protein
VSGFQDYTTALDKPQVIAQYRDNSICPFIWRATDFNRQHLIRHTTAADHFGCAETMPVA